MKKDIFILLLLIPFFGHSQFRIQGNFPNDNNTTTIYLNENIGGKYYILDSCRIKENGVFIFDGNYNTGYYSISLNDSNWVQFIVQRKELEVIMKFKSRNLRNSIKIIESKENKALWDFMNYRKEIMSNLSFATINKGYHLKNSPEYSFYQNLEDSINQEYNDHILSIYKKDTSSFFGKTIISDFRTTAKNDFFKYTFFKDSELIHSGVLTRKVTEFLQFHTKYTEEGFINSVDIIMNKSSENEIVYDFILNYLLELFNEVGPDIILDYLVESYVMSESCSDLQTSEIISSKLEAYRQLKIGKKAPALSMFDIDGTLKNLADICSLSHFNILVFGSSHCQFCQNAIPPLMDFISDYEPTEIKVIYISLDTLFEDWKREMVDKPMNWVSFSELKGWKSISTNIFQIHKTPSFFILSSDYTILSKPKTIDELLTDLEFLGQKKTHD